jgi:hypothetical protein
LQETNRQVRFQAGKHTLIPYGEFGLVTDKKNKTLPIKSIIVGPTTKSRGITEGRQDSVGRGRHVRASGSYCTRNILSRSLGPEEIWTEVVFQCFNMDHNVEEGHGKNYLRAGYRFYCT